MKKEICLLNKESKNGQRCERTNMAAKCEMFMNCSKKIHRHLQRTNMTANKLGILKEL